VLSSAIGHLLELAVPEEYDVKRGKWSFTHLPMIPPHFALNPIEKTQERLRLLTRLIKRKDVTGLVNACDAGREGELIFRYVAQHALGAKQKPIRRLWLQSMTATAIRDGFAHLRTDEEMLPLADAARCRSEADWLIGINGTRAMTAFNSKEGGFYKTPVGRVQTPTLAIMVERESRIAPSSRATTGKSRANSSASPAPIAAAGSTRNSRRPTMNTPAPSACGTRPGRMPAQEMPGPARHGGRGKQAQDRSLSDALRPHLAAA
jgi:DNA topoisomerase IA